MQNKTTSLCKIILISSIFILPSCDSSTSITEDITNRISGHINQSIVDNLNNGKNADETKKMHLTIIRKGVLDLENMNDPNISEVYKVLDKHLSDNDMSMYDYQTIASIINKHKTAISKFQSNHQNDVKEFRKNIN